MKRPGIRIRLSFLLAGLLCVWAGGPASRAAELPWDFPIPGVESPYSAKLVSLLRAWPPAGVAALRPGDGPMLRLRCLRTPGNELYQGFEQVQWIRAPLGQVASILDAIDDYERIFPDLADVRLLSKRDNLWIGAWEQRIPLFFVPNVKYEMAYVVSSLGPGRRLYRYQLHRGSSLKRSDGFILLESQPGGLVRYSEYDFYDADWGPARILGERKIWRENAEGIARSDVAIRLKAENPAKTSEWAREEARKLLPELKAQTECSDTESADAFFAGAARR